MRHNTAGHGWMSFAKQSKMGLSFCYACLVADHGDGSQCSGHEGWGRQGMACARESARDWRV